MEPTSTNLPLKALFAAAAAILVIVGSIGPWAKVLFFSVSGTEGDGMITLLTGLIAGVLVIVRLARPASHAAHFQVPAALAFGIAAAVGIYDWANITSVAADAEENVFDVDVAVGWGLVVMTLAAIAGVVLSMLDTMTWQSAEAVEVVPNRSPAAPRPRVRREYVNPFHRSQSSDEPSTDPPTSADL